MKINQKINNKNYQYWKGYQGAYSVPWYHEYRGTADIYFKEKYKLIELQNKVRKLVKDHGCDIKYTDEYGTPYVETPEGYQIELA